MKMKTTPGDVSHQELIQEIRKNTRVAIEASQQEILEAIGAFATSVDERFNRVEGEMVGIRREVVGIKEEIVGIKKETVGIKGVMITKEVLQDELSKFKTTMVTKDYLDDKLADLRSDIVRHTEKRIEKALG